MSTYSWILENIAEVIKKSCWKRYRKYFSRLFFGIIGSSPAIYSRAPRPIKYPVWVPTVVPPPWTTFLIIFLVTTSKLFVKSPSECTTLLEFFQDIGFRNITFLQIFKKTRFRQLQRWSKISPKT